MAAAVVPAPGGLPGLHTCLLSAVCRTACPPAAARSTVPRSAAQGQPGSTLTDKQLGRPHLSDRLRSTPGLLKESGAAQWIGRAAAAALHCLQLRRQAAGAAGAGCVSLCSLWPTPARLHRPRLARLAGVSAGSPHASRDAPQQPHAGTAHLGAGIMRRGRGGKQACHKPACSLSQAAQHAAARSAGSCAWQQPCLRCWSIQLFLASLLLLLLLCLHAAGWGAAAWVRPCPAGGAVLCRAAGQATPCWLLCQVLRSLWRLPAGLWWQRSLSRVRLSQRTGLGALLAGGARARCPAWAGQAAAAPALPPVLARGPAGCGTLQAADTPACTCPVRPAAAVCRHGPHTAGSASLSLAHHGAHDPGGAGTCRQLQGSCASSSAMLSALGRSGSA